MGSCFREENTEQNTLAHSCSLQLISIWAGAGVSTWAIDAQILTHVAGEGTLIDVWEGADANKLMNIYDALTQLFA